MNERPYILIKKQALFKRIKRDKEEIYSENNEINPNFIPYSINYYDRNR